MERPKEFEICLDKADFRAYNLSLVSSIKKWR